MVMMVTIPNGIRNQLDPEADWSHAWLENLKWPYFTKYWRQRAEILGKDRAPKNSKLEHFFAALMTK